MSASPLPDLKEAEKKAETGEDAVATGEDVFAPANFQEVPLDKAEGRARHHSLVAAGKVPDKKVILIAGPPSGGKGTQAKRMKGNFPIVHISTGSMLREEAKTNQKLADTMASGALVDDQYVFDALLNRLKKPDVQAAEGVLLDGFPRNKKQAGMLKKADIQVHLFVLLDVADAECEKRVLGRAQSAKDAGKEPRKDDTSDVIKARLKTYHDTIDAFADCYKTCTTKVDGNSTADATWKEVELAVASLFAVPKEVVEAGKPDKITFVPKGAASNDAASSDAASSDVAPIHIDTEPVETQRTPQNNKDAKTKACCIVM